MDKLEKVLEMLSVRDSGGKTAESFTDLVNSSVFKSDDVVKELINANIQVQFDFLNICLLWIYKLDYLATTDTQRYDQRNKYSVDTGNLIYRELKYYMSGVLMRDECDGVKTYQLSCKDDYLNDVDLPYEVSFVQYMSLSHRTLQEEFSEIVFKWLLIEQEGLPDIFGMLRDKALALNERKGFVKPFISVVSS